MNTFKLTSPFKPTGNQPEAIEALVQGLEHDIPFQTLLGVTGSGKTFTVANVVMRRQQPALILSHNKTLAAQLYEELKRFFPDSAVHYFVSYYDYYQPEAYIPQTNTYIEKDASINAEIDRLRHATTQTVLSRDDVIVVASVSAIYNIGSPQNYASLSLSLTQGQKITQRQLVEHLVELQYDRNDTELTPGAFRVRGETLSIALPTGQEIIAVTLTKNGVAELTRRGVGIDDPQRSIKNARIFPAKFWVTPRENHRLALTNIEAELTEREREFKKRGKLLEAQRIVQRTRADLSMIRETGYCHGIENYSRHLEFREADSPPFTLLNYFNEAHGEGKWLMIIDESHQTIPQVRGMVRGDRSRKDVLIEHGFRLPSARDNRPLTFKEFLERIGPVIFASATPGEYERQVSKRIRIQDSPNQEGAGQAGFKIQDGFVEQMVRPTGLLDPTIEIRPTQGQLDYLIREIEKRVEKKQRVLVTTITKRLAEELSDWLSERNIRVEYIHADIKTLERPEILHRLRAGEIDVLVGINLLREGLDLPEVSLVAILDADQEGFLRNETTLIQVMGRTARHIEGHVILFADTVTRSMKAAIAETGHRRSVQEQWNREHNITPRSIEKSVERSTLIGPHEEEEMPHGPVTKNALKDLRVEMKKAASQLDFERAAKIRDLITKLTLENQ